MLRIYTNRLDTGFWVSVLCERADGLNLEDD